MVSDEIERTLVDSPSQLPNEGFLEELQQRLESEGLKELWVDPTGDCLFEALAQQLFMYPELRQEAEEKGYIFEPVTDKVDGITILRFPEAAKRCRPDLASYMRAMGEELDVWNGMSAHERNEYINDLAKPGQLCCLLTHVLCDARY